MFVRQQNWEETHWSQSKHNKQSGRQDWTCPQWARENNWFSLYFVESNSKSAGNTMGPTLQFTTIINAILSDSHTACQSVCSGGHVSYDEVLFCDEFLHQVSSLSHLRVLQLLLVRRRKREIVCMQERGTHLQLTDHRLHS